MNHFNVSMIKSALRIVGYIILTQSIHNGVILLTLAEGLGILEEIFDNRKE